MSPPSTSVPDPEFHPPGARTYPNDRAISRLALIGVAIGAFAVAIYLIASLL